MLTETRKLTDIIPYENNPRINDGAVDAVAESIRQCGYIAPIIVDEDGVILAGHTRHKALQKLGMAEAEVLVKTGLTEEQKRKYRLLDNKTNELAAWDFDKLVQELDGLDFGDLDLDWGSQEDEEPEDETEKLHDDGYEPREPAEPKSQTGDIYQLGRHRLICGDSTDKAVIDALMAGAEADLLLTDPPYNVNYDEKEKRLLEFRPNKRVEENRNTGIDNDAMGPIQFKEFLVQAFEQSLGAIRPGGGVYIFHPDRERPNFQEAFQDAGGKYQQILIWVKNHIVLSQRDYQWQHEPILYGVRPGSARYFTPARDNSTVIDDAKPVNPNKMTKSDLVEEVKSLRLALQEKQPTDVLRFDKPAASDLHPTMKPIKLVGYLMANSTRPGESVLDPFGGSGSTLIAAEQLGRRCYMAELSPKYVDVIIDRWEQFTGQKAVKLN